MDRFYFVGLPGIAYMFCFAVAKQTRRPPLAMHSPEYIWLRASIPDETHAGAFLQLLTKPRQSMDRRGFFCRAAGN